MKDLLQPPVTRPSPVEESQRRPWHLNIDAGDSAIHVLVESGNVQQVPTKVVLVDGGFKDYGGFWINKIRGKLKTHYGLQHDIKFDGLVVTHFDADHYGGIVQLFDDDIQNQWNRKLENKSENQFSYEALNAKWKELMEAYSPSFLNTEAHIYMPYWDKCNTKEELRNALGNVNFPPKSWIRDASKFRIQKKGSWDTAVEVRSPVIAKLHSDSSTLLGFDLFYGEQACTLSAEHLTDPKKVSKNLKRNRPSMFCVMADMHICGGYTYKGLEKWEWDKTDFGNSFVKVKGDMEEEEARETERSQDSDTNLVLQSDDPVGFIPKVDTKNNNSSIACMITWKNTERAQVSHYFAGDLSEATEQMVLKWSTVPSVDDAKKRLATRVKTMKMSHHGARQSTPFEMLYSFDPEYVFVSNGVRNYWRHPKPEVLLALDAWKQWKAATEIQLEDQQPPKRLDFLAANYPPWLTTIDDKRFMDPGGVTEMKKSGFMTEVTRLSEKSKTNFFDGVKDLKGEDFKNYLVNHLMARWSLLSTLDPSAYADCTTVTAKWFTISSTQKIRAFYFAQSHDDQVTMDKTTFQDMDKIIPTEIPPPVRNFRTEQHQPAEQRKSKRIKEMKEKQTRGIPTEISNDTKATQRLIAKRAVKNKPESKKKQRGHEDEDEDELEFSNSHAEPQREHFERLAFINIDSQTSVEVQDLYLCRFLRSLAFPALILSRVPASDEPADYELDACDEMSSWFGAIFKAGQRMRFRARASTKHIAQLSFETNLIAIEPKLASNSNPGSNAFSQMLQFRTDLGRRSLGLPSDATGVAIENMLVFGLDSEAAKEWKLNLKDIFNFLQWDPLNIVLSGALNEGFSLDSGSDGANRNAVWFIPGGSTHRTVLRLQFSQVQQPGERPTWLSEVFAKFGRFFDLSVESPIQAILRKTYSMETTVNDKYLATIDWELTVRAKVTIANKSTDSLKFWASIIIITQKTQMVLMLLAPETQGVAGNGGTDIGSICDFVSGFLPLDMPVPSVKQYIPPASDMMLRKIVFTRGGGRKNSIEIDLQVNLASAPFLVTVRLGPEPQFSGNLFPPMRSPREPDMALYPVYEDHLLMLPIGFQEDNGIRLDIPFGHGGSELASESDAMVDLRIGQVDGCVILVCEINITRDLTIIFAHLKQKRANVSETNPYPTKRVLFFRLADINLTGKASPFVSALVQPFDELHFVWVDGGKLEQGKASGLTRSDVDILNRFLVEKHSLHFKDPAAPASEKTLLGDAPGASGVILKAGCHFLVVNDSKVILDYSFQGKGKNPSGKKTADNGEESEHSGVAAPLKKQVGPVRISGISLGFSRNRLSIILTATAQLGTFSVSLVGLTIYADFAEAGHLLDFENAKVGISLSGLALGLDSSPLRMAGTLIKESSQDQEKDVFSGGATVGFKKYSILGLGKYSETKSTGAVSFFAYVQLNGPLAKIGAVEISGVKAGVGYNTGIRTPDLSHIAAFPFCAQTPRSLQEIGTASKDPLQILDNFLNQGWFYDSPGNTWLAMGMEAVICETVNISAAVIVTVTPKVLLDIYGQGHIQMPPSGETKKAYLSVDIGIKSSVDFKTGSLVIESSLGPQSFILDPACHFSGGFAIATWWDPSKAAGDWVFTVGGYHPRFNAPQYYPKPERLRVWWNVGAGVSISGGPPVHGTVQVEACSHNITVSFGSNPGNKNTGPLGFDAMCQLLLKEDKRSDKTYHLLNLISGGLPTVPESVESSHDTPWVVRPAIFSFHVQSIIPISGAAINPPAIVQDLEELQALGINGDATKVPHVSVSSKAEAPIYSKPMQLSGSNEMKINLFVTIAMGDSPHPSAAFVINEIYDNVSSTLWGEYKQSEDPLRSGNNIAALLNPPAAGSRSKLMTGITVSSLGPTISTDTLGKFDASLISEAELFDSKNQPILPSQASQTYGLPMKRTLDMRPRENDLQFGARWGLGRPRRRAGKPPRVKESASNTNKQPKDLWDGVAEYWSDNNKSDTRRGVAQAATAIFEWEDDAFVDISRKPDLLLAQFEDIYLAPPHISAPVTASNERSRRHIESGLIIGAENGWTSGIPCIKDVLVRFEEPFDFPPVILPGITAFDFAGLNSPRMLVQSENVTRQGFKMNMQSWDYEMYAFDTSWMALYHPDIHFEHGNVDSMDVFGRKQFQDAVCHVGFSTPYISEPQVVCWFTWITPVKHCELECKVIRVTKYGCTIRIGSWGDEPSPYHRAKVSWLAFESDAQGVQAGVRKFSNNEGWTAETPLNDFRYPPKDKNTG
ncbi:hypothetical protein FACUT_12497 [Fusarium acutatum]|uniref:Uncharacterized protein n=1 Tax=Fusarium acutatum TaxID=78861 RepID=A0A8H4N9L6_9HYPO|nr:hypothetical protein FACUT_12497 [Fusarium acutatum]